MVSFVRSSSSFCEQGYSILAACDAHMLCRGRTRVEHPASGAIQTPGPGHHPARWRTIIEDLREKPDGWVAAASRHVHLRHGRLRNLGNLETDSAKTRGLLISVTLH